jgi:hypothetical protein
MTLDLVRVAEQMPSLLHRLGDERRTNQQRLDAAQVALSDWAQKPEEWRERVRTAQTRWPLAIPLDERADQGYAAPPIADTYVVLAADGSHIDVDRHAAARCYVLNLGWSTIYYGASVPPVLDSRAEVQPSTDTLIHRDEEDASGEDSIRGETLSLLRSVRELALLSALAAELPPELPRVALLDGNLGLWNVTQAPISRRLREHLIRGEGGLLPSLNALRSLARAGGLAFGAYTSAPGTADVVHALRVAVCPLEDVACTRCPGLASATRPCDEVGVLSDADLFWSVLEPGERSAIFETRSKAFLRPGEPKTQPWYESEGHMAAFFYLRLEEEVARVELPRWMADDAEGVSLLHAALVDQCAKGFGYPVALQEAHEQAVITTVDRRSFAALLEREVAESGITPAGSAKSRSKARRSI